MSVQTAIDNIWLKPTDRWSHTEYSMEYHEEYIERLTGKFRSDPDFYRALCDTHEFDFLFMTHDGLREDWLTLGRATDMGHAEYAADGSDRQEPTECPFKTAEEVWAFDAVEEYGLPDFDEQVKAYQQFIRDARRKYPNQLTTGGYYKSIVSGAIQAFGWDMLLLAASDPAKMEKVFESFFRRTLFHMKAWAKTSVEAVIQHDDFVWANGPFMQPDIYRRIIIPLYAELWKPLHEEGKKVLFCSDGNFMEFAEDVVNAGADGLVFEPCNDFETMVDKFGRTHCLVGSFVDCRDLTFGTWEKVKQDIDKTFRKLSECRGAIVCVGNHLPANISAEMLDKYFDHVKQNLNK